MYPARGASATSSVQRGLVIEMDMEKEVDNKFLKAAIEYNRVGFSVIPLWPRTKKPMLSEWSKYSTARSTQEEIEQWWKEMPDANIGIALGPSNGEDGRYLFVVDQDPLKDEKTRLPLLNDDGSFKQLGDISGCPRLFRKPPDRVQSNSSIGLLVATMSAIPSRVSLSILKGSVDRL